MSNFIHRAAGPLIVAATAVAMLCWTWSTWPDPLTDFGKEVYIAWQLSLGQHLYTDVAYHLGPFSPCLNALVFKTFGATLATIEGLNLCVLIAIVVLFHRLIRRIAGEFAATTAAVTFFCLFAFTHFTPITDYNYMAPYDHAHTHGLLLGLLAITFADQYNRSNSRAALIAAAVMLGLAFLTRAELFLAAFAGTIVTLFLHRRFAGRALPIFFLAAIVPILLALILFPAHGVFGSWLIVLDQRIPSNPFYRDSMGTADLGQSITRLLTWTAWWSLLFLPPILMSRSRRHAMLWTILAALLAVAVALLIACTNQDYADAFAPLPLALIAALIYLRHQRHRLGSATTIPLAAGALVWALVLLGKIILNARIYHYGFVLAMPAVLLIVAIGTGWTPRPLRAAVLAALAMVAYGYLFSSSPSSAANLMRRQIYSVGENENQFWADQRGEQINKVLAVLTAKSAPGQTLAVMPEGALLNFLTGLPNSTPYWSFQPPYSFFSPGQGETAAQQTIFRSLLNNPPDWIVLTDPAFGRDYGLDLYAFTQHGYSTEFATPGFAMILLRRVGYNEPHALPPR